VNTATTVKPALVSDWRKAKRRFISFFAP